MLSLERRDDIRRHFGARIAILEYGRYRVSQALSRRLLPRLIEKRAQEGTEYEYLQSEM